MTSLLPPSTKRTAADVERDLATRRPLTPLALLGGVAAAASTLVVCLGIGVVGWFLTDAGAHGSPGGALRVGALGWLMGHGSGVRVEGVAITAVPLGITLLAAWATWRVGLRVGDSVSGHGPDADAIADGERDWTVPIAVAMLTAGYVVTAVATATLAATPATDPSAPRVVLWSLLLCLGAGGPAIAIGSGRAAIWAAGLPPLARAAGHGCRRILQLWLAVAAVAFVVALAADFGTAANVMSQLHTDAGDAALVVALSVVVVPNAVAWSGAYVLGPGFTVGAGTLVTPNAVALGPLPMFPMLAALPDDGDTPGWTPWLVALPVLVGLLGAAWAQRRQPTTRWDEGALRGCAGGVLAGIGFGVLAAVAGGAVGPGRLRDVGPLAFDALVHAITAFGIGGLLGGLAMTFWARRTARGGERSPT
jgi:hypothetical protein